MCVAILPSSVAPLFYDALWMLLEARHKSKAISGNSITAINVNIAVATKRTGGVVFLLIFAFNKHFSKRFFSRQIWFD